MSLNCWIFSSYVQPSDYILPLIHLWQSPLSNQPAQPFPVLLLGNSTLGKIHTPELFHSAGKYFLLCNMPSCTLQRTQTFLKVWSCPMCVRHSTQKLVTNFPSTSNALYWDMKACLLGFLFSPSFYSEISSSTHKELRLFLLNMSFLWTCRILSE